MRTERRERDGSRWFTAAGAAFRATGPLLLLLLATPGAASEVNVALDDGRGACRVRGRFAAPVSASLAWGVLTDYNGIGRFVRSVRASRIEPQPDGRRLLRQDAVGGVFLFRRRMQVLLELDEKPDSLIRFRDVLGKDFRTYVGGWSLVEGPRGVEVTYELEAEPRAAITRAFCRGSLQGAARDLLAEVRAEMLRRGSDHELTKGRNP